MSTLLAVVAVAACAAAAPRADVATDLVRPVITRLAPDSGPAGVAYPIRVTIEGRAFAPMGNVVTFGPVTIPDLSSTDGGTQLIFWVPKERPSGGEAAPFVLPPGAYDVSVTTPAGTSEAARFRLTAPSASETDRR